MSLILASTSPRRRELLKLLGLSFEVIAPKFDERVSIDRPIEDDVLDFAIGKSRSVADSHPRSIVIGSDTMISIDGNKIGKPGDLADARRMLRALAGRRHRIYTSVAIIDGLGGHGLTRIEVVDVMMRDFSDTEIERYLAHGESLDKAGAYSIQGEGRQLIEFIEGDYLAAVGLPLKPIAEYLTDRGIIPPVSIKELYAAKSFLNWRSF